MIRQQFLDTPAMIRDPGGHSWHRGACSAETRMRGTEMIPRAAQGHAVLQGGRAAGQRCQALAKGRVEPLDVRGVITPCPCERRRSVSTRAGVPATMRRSTSTTRRGAERLTTWATQTLRQGRSRGRPAPPVRCGSRKVSRIARREATKPSVQNNKGRWAAQRRTRSISRRINGMSRWALTSPASPSRVLTISASAIQPMPPWVLTRLSSAWTGPRARGCSTRYS